MTQNSKLVTHNSKLSLDHALEPISRRVRIIRLTPECAEFIAKNLWFEIQTVPGGFRIRVYDYNGHVRSATAPTAISAIDIARSLGRGIRSTGCIDR